MSIAEKVRQADREIADLFVKMKASLDSQEKSLDRIEALIKLMPKQSTIQIKG